MMKKICTLCELGHGSWIFMLAALSPEPFIELSLMPLRQFQRRSNVMHEVICSTQISDILAVSLEATANSLMFSLVCLLFAT